MAEEKYLVVSVNCFSETKNNGKTVASLFKNINQGNISMLYFYPEFPTTMRDVSYYRITDADVLNAFIHNKISGGRIYCEADKNDISNNVASRKKLYYLSNSQFFRFSRDLIWSSNKWKTKKLDNWIKSTNSNTLFISGLNNFGLLKYYFELITNNDSTTFVYATDDYFLPYVSLSLFRHLRRKRLVKWMKKIINIHNVKLVCINEYMKEEYDKLFNTKALVVSNNTFPKNKLIKAESIKNRDRKIISYCGNLSFNRYKIIYWLASKIDEMELTNKFEIRVYSENITQKQLKMINKTKCCSYCGSATSDEVEKIREESNILLIVESFDYFNRKKTKLSLSTKVTESLLSHRAILAIGPKDVGTMRFLIEKTESVCITDKADTDVRRKLEYLLNDVEIEKIATKGYKEIINYLKSLDTLFE